MSKLPDLPTSKNKKYHKNFNKSQPFWNDELCHIWKEVCRTERAYVQFKVTDTFDFTLKSMTNFHQKLTLKLINDTNIYKNLTFI